MKEIDLFAAAMGRQTVPGGPGAGNVPLSPLLSLSPGGESARGSDPRADHIVYIVAASPAPCAGQTWPDYWGGMPSGQMGEAATLVARGAYGRNNTCPDWDLLASIDVATVR